MLEPWVKRAFVWAAPVALLACAALAGYVYQLQRAEYDDLEQRQAVIEEIRFSQTGVGGQHTRMKTLVVTVRRLDDPRAKPQELSSDAPMERLAGYYQDHRRGDVIPVWVKRKSGRVVDVMPPSPPDFVRLLLILLPTLGLFAFLIIMAVFGNASQRRPSTEN